MKSKDKDFILIMSLLIFFSGFVFVSIGGIPKPIPKNAVYPSFLQNFTGVSDCSGLNVTRETYTESDGCDGDILPFQWEASSNIIYYNKVWINDTAYRWNMTVNFTSLYPEN